MTRSARSGRLDTAQGLPVLRSFPTANEEKGVALLLTLMLVALMGALGLTMMLTVSPDLLINGYYSNYRGSFYAADSGLNIARQQLINQVQSAVTGAPCTGWVTGPSTPSCSQPPIASTTASTVLSNILSSSGYGSFSSLNAGQASGAWPENFQIINTATCPSTVTAGAPIAIHQNAQGQNDQYQYQFNYSLCSMGRAGALQQVLTKESGIITIKVMAQTSTSASTTVSFAAFGGFINNFPPCTGSLVPGTMTGPMFTNGAWQFGTQGSYIFTDPVGQANANADYWYGGHCVQSPTSSYTYNNQLIKPTFQGGYNLGQPTAPLPPNDFSQEWAVLDGKGCGEGSSTCGSSSPPSPTHANLNAALKNISGTAYPTSGTSSGVYLPYCTSCTNPNTVNGGGLYVEGNASVQLSTATDTSANPTQVYTITQGSTVTTITTNVAANTTTVQSGSTTLTLTGVPQNLTGSSPQPGTMLYVNGTISSLSGPGQGQPAIQDGSQVTITANGNVNITGDVIYKHEPVTQTSADALIPGNDFNQVLGIFTASGNINLSTSYSNHNLQVDGSLAAIGQNCAANSCGFTVSGYINTFNNVGGQIQSNIFSANMNTENTYFDRRFTSRAGFSPPWFPSTTLPTVDVVNALPPLVITSQPQRLTWTTSPQ